MKDLNLVNTAAISLLAYGPSSDSNGIASTRGVLNVQNVEISGKAVALGNVNSALFGYIQSPVNDQRTLINVTNSKIDFDMYSTSENTALLVGHGQAKLVLDKSTKDFMDSNSRVLIPVGAAGNRRFYHGNSNGNHVYLKEGNVETSLTLENNSRVSKTLDYSNNTTMQFGQNLSFEKGVGSVLALVTIQYQLVQGGYTRLLQEKLDTSVFKVGDNVISSLKKLRFTQDTVLQNNPDYYYVRESNDFYNLGISNNVIVTIVQLNSDNGIVSIIRHNYSNN